MLAWLPMPPTNSMLNADSKFGIALTHVFPDIQKCEVLFRLPRSMSFASFTFSAI